MPKPSFDIGQRTPQQAEAITREGFVLVSAGAGSGKTSTLVDKCLYWLIQKKTTLDQLLVVTFTEAAAGEMRRRVREGLEKAITADPADEHLQEQFALLDTANISTIHSFCFKLVKQNFHEISIDPRVSVMESAQENLLGKEVLENFFEECYAGSHPLSPAVKNLVAREFSGKADLFGKIIFELHRFASTQPRASVWLTQQLDLCQKQDPGDLLNLRRTEFYNWERSWQSRSATCPELLPFVEKLKALPSTASPEQILLALDCKKKSDKNSKVLDRFLKEAVFWRTLFPRAGQKDPVTEDWECCREKAKTLIEITVEFGQRLLKAKQMMGQLGFDDIQQLTLELLSGEEAGRRKIREALQSQFSLIVVDEYQDINPAQDEIIRSLSSNESTRLFVGDVKQSIYGFRLATPHIFLDYIDGQKGQTTLLNENFRSHEKILDFINSNFDLLMTRSSIGVDYATSARLQLGARDKRPLWTSVSSLGPRVEYHLLKSDKAAEVDEISEDHPDLSNVEAEALMIAQSIIALKTKMVSVDGKPFAWADIAILFRALSGKYETYARVFEQMGIPVAGTAETFEESAEASDLVSLLSLLDNFMQDVPLAAVMRSPFGGFSSLDLASIRIEMGQNSKPFWQIVKNFSTRPSTGSSSLQTKVIQFLQQYDKWRRLTRGHSIPSLLEKIMAQTGYWNFLESQPRASTRLQFVQRFLDLASTFEASSGTGIHSFLNWWEIQSTLEFKNNITTAGIGVNAVQLLTIHRSKGLEFPIVVVADVAKVFNSRDTTKEIIPDSNLELCSVVHNHEKGTRYSSLPHWLAVRKRKEELSREELRLLYVALTRAKEHLLISGKTGKKESSEYLDAFHRLKGGEIFEFNSFADWLLPIAVNHGLSLEHEAGATNLFSWKTYNKSSLQIESVGQGITSQSISPELLEQTLQTLQFTYPHLEATRQTAKTSASSLKSLDDTELLEELVVSLNFQYKSNFPGKNGAELGTLTHRFLEILDFDCCQDEAAAKINLSNAIATGHLETDAATTIDLPGIVHFWNSALGKDLLLRKKELHRELPFTAKFSPGEIGHFTQKPDSRLTLIAETDFIIVQGLVDLAWVGQDEIWIIDFKTDKEINQARNLDFYRNQLLIYSSALERVFRKKVTRRFLHFFSGRRTLEI